MYGNPCCTIATLAVLHSQICHHIPAAGTESRYCSSLSRCWTSVRTLGLHFCVTDPLCEVSLMLQFRSQFLLVSWNFRKWSSLCCLMLYVFAPTVCVQRPGFTPVPLCFFPHNVHVDFNREQGPEIMAQYEIWLQPTSSIVKNTDVSQFRPVL